MVRKIKTLFQQDAILTASLFLAFLSCIIIHPDTQYIGYIDFNTMIMLFCLMLIMQGLKEQNFFQQIGEMILGKVGTERGIILTLVFLCFFSSMFITNDVALITFIPFGLLILEMINLSSMLCITITLMTIAANLGSMLTPIGNPQNLYLFSISEYSLQEFLLLTLPYTVVSAVLLFILIVIRYKKNQIEMRMQKQREKINKQVYYYLLLFFLCLLSVGGVIPRIILFGMISVCIFIKDKRLFLKIDYALLLTFLCFFIFIGNMNRMESLHELIINVIETHERIISIGISQMISNVPAALLLSGYTDNIRELIIGTNIGGLGTLIASMASLISYKQVAIKYPQQKKRYLLTFTYWNLIFLVILCLL
ncbi:Inner membrane protein YbiR [Clostridiales bacterium CHKCI001]|nr:Inner membrane protein YbiR [Clostridiales bacterium CHKCI001]